MIFISEIIKTTQRMLSVLEAHSCVPMTILVIIPGRRGMVITIAFGTMALNHGATLKADTCT